MEKPHFQFAVACDTWDARTKHGEKFTSQATIRPNGIAQFTLLVMLTTAYPSSEAAVSLILQLPEAEPLFIREMVIPPLGQLEAYIAPFELDLAIPGTDSGYLVICLDSQPVYDFPLVRDRGVA